jgi:putative flippase GtrA
MGCMYVLIEFIHAGDIVAKIFTQILVVVANYVFSKFLIFKRT